MNIDYLKYILNGKNVLILVELLCLKSLASTPSTSQIHGVYMNLT
jgi:hypothetical protein